MIKNVLSFTIRLTKVVLSMRSLSLIFAVDEIQFIIFLGVFTCYTKVETLVTTVYHVVSCKDCICKLFLGYNSCFLVYDNPVNCILVNDVVMGGGPDKDGLHIHFPF